MCGTLGWLHRNTFFHRFFLASHINRIDIQIVLVAYTNFTSLIGIFIQQNYSDIHAMYVYIVCALCMGLFDLNLLTLVCRNVSVTEFEFDCLFYFYSISFCISLFLFFGRFHFFFPCTFLYCKALTQVFHHLRVLNKSA